MTRSLKKHAVLMLLSILAGMAPLRTSAGEVGVDAVRNAPTNSPHAVIVQADTTDAVWWDRVKLDETDAGWRIRGTLQLKRLYGGNGGHVDVVGNVESGRMEVLASSSYIGIPRGHARHRKVSFHVHGASLPPSSRRLLLTFHSRHVGWDGCHPLGHP